VITLVRNLSQIATPTGRTAVRGRAMRDLTVIERGVLVIEDGRFVYVGRESEMPALRIDQDIDVKGATAIPGFVDAHTHIPFSGFRESEFNRRLRGESYEDIAASGGGIASTVRATRGASIDELVTNILARTETMARYGTTTAEAKSGYGLDTESELKQLRAIRAADAKSPVRLVPTCLAAHEFPREIPRQQWIDTIVEEILPRVARTVEAMPPPEAAMSS
jgi:imidazolonepropionase